MLMFIFLIVSYLSFLSFNKEKFFINMYFYKGKVPYMVVVKKIKKLLTF